MSKQREARQGYLMILLCLACSLLLALLSLADLSLMQSGEKPFLDYHLNRVSVPENNSNIVVLLAGDRTLSELGSWPMPRKVYADLLADRLIDGDTIVLDVLYSEQGDADDDLLLRKAIAAHGSVVLANVVETDSHYGIQPLPELERESAAIGYVNSFPDGDMVSRKHRLLIEKEVDGTTYLLPSLVCAGLSVHGRIAEIDPDAAYFVKQDGTKTALPLDPDNAFWKPSLPEDAYPCYELSDVYSGKVPAEVFDGALVFIGISATGAADIARTPGGYRSGVEYLADSAYIALSGFNPLPVPNWVIPLAVFLFSALCALLVSRLSWKWSWSVPVLLALAWFLAAHIAFMRNLAYIPAFPVIASVLAAYVLSILFRYAAAQRSALTEIKKRQELFYSTIRCLVSAIDAKDPVTAGHSERVSAMAADLAADMGMDTDAVENIRFAGLIHDVGKIGISDEVLNKPGILSNSEFAQMKTHPEKGCGIMAELDLPEPILAGILDHHEREDGKGYPHGKTGGELSLTGKIIKVADVYDALISERQYKDAWPLENVCNLFYRQKGIEFDDRVARLLLDRVRPAAWSPPGDGQKSSRPLPMPLYRHGERLALQFLSQAGSPSTLRGICTAEPELDSHQGFCGMEWGESLHSRFFRLMNPDLLFYDEERAFYIYGCQMAPPREGRVYYGFLRGYLTIAACDCTGIQEEAVERFGEPIPLDSALVWDRGKTLCYLFEGDGAQPPCLVNVIKYMCDEK